jgi:hypothetical protein
MMFMTHHKVRQPVANILGLSQMLEQYIKAPVTLRKLVGYMELSAKDLDAFTKELTVFIGALEKKGKRKRCNISITEKAPRFDTAGPFLLEQITYHGNSSPK